MLPGADSSAVDVGNAVTCADPHVNKFDPRGVSRPQSSACDIGAVKVQGDEMSADEFDSVAL